MNRLKTLIGAAMIAAATLCSAQAEKMTGRWTTIDDKTGEAKSIVDIYRAEDGKYYGKIVEILIKGGEDALCDKCPGELKGKPIVGLVILQEMEYKDEKLQGGHVTDPENGKTYYGKIWIDKENGHLILRGSLDKRGIFGRNQEWIRSNE